MYISLEGNLFNTHKCSNGTSSSTQRSLYFIILVEGTLFSLSLEDYSGQLEQKRRKKKVNARFVYVIISMMMMMSFCCFNMKTKRKRTKCKANISTTKKVCNRSRT